MYRSTMLFEIACQISNLYGECAADCTRFARIRALDTNLSARRKTSRAQRYRCCRVMTQHHSQSRVHARRLSVSVHHRHVVDAWETCSVFGATSSLQCSEMWIGGATEVVYSRSLEMFLEIGAHRQHGEWCGIMESTQVRHIARSAARSEVWYWKRSPACSCQLPIGKGGSPGAFDPFRLDPAPYLWPASLLIKSVFP